MLSVIWIVVYLLSSSFIVTCRPNQVPLQHQSVTSLKAVLDHEFEEWFNETGSKWGMKGVAIAVTRRTRDAAGEWDGWVTELKGYGIADRWGHAVDEDTLFGIGSNSKFFTALAIGMLVEDETYPLKWDTKIKDILPEGEWKLQDPVMEQNADLVDILSHRTGLPRHELSYSRSDTTRSLVSKLRYLPPSAEFRQIYQYNNQMYSTAAYIVERMTNKTVQEFVTEKILKPLGMDASTYSFKETMVGRGLADGFVAVESDQLEGDGRVSDIYKPVPYFDVQGNTSVIAGAGGVISNLEDLTIWLQTLLLDGRHPATDEQIVPAAAILKAAEGVSVPGPSPIDPSISPQVYGFGQQSYSYQGHYLVEHSGATVGHYTVISRAPYDGVGVAILTNALPPAGFVLMSLVKWRLFEKALGLKHVDWESKIPVPQKLSGNLSVKSKTQMPHPLRFYTGVYSHPAYGEIILCPFNDTSTIQSEIYLSHCRTVVSEISQAYKGPQPDLVSSWDKYFSTHVVISHSEQNTFVARSLIIFPPPFPDSKNDRDNKPFALTNKELPADAVATFVVDEHADEVLGIAMKNIWGAEGNAKVLEGTSEATAEVWFERVGGL